MSDLEDEDSSFRKLLAADSLLGLTEWEAERTRRELREAYGLNYLSEEIRRLQYGRADEAAHMMGISVASLGQIVDSNALRHIAKQQLATELYRRKEADILALQEIEHWRAKQYRYLELQEASQLLAAYDPRPVTKWLEMSTGLGLDLEAALESIRTPFLDVDATLASVSVAAELQSIGQAIRATTAFELEFVRSLRTGLGDWRDPIPWSSVSLENESDRLDLYVTRGLNLELTNLPAAAFQDILGRSGLLQALPAADAQYGEETFIVQYDDGIDPQRNAQAYEQLLRFERHLRAFLDRVMRAAFGEDWPRRRVPKDVLESWVVKREKAVKAGENPRPLIAYADFSDYEKIISRKDNWREVFAVVFIRPESIRESLQRLYPVRHCTMHARPVTQEDELLMQVEIHRVVKATRR